MIRLACSFGLAALAIVVVLAIRPDGGTAILFSFIGLPAIAIALILYAVARWRAGAFRMNGTPRPSPRERSLA